ncbi:dihydrofolate reductase family protein [Streptomyces sp. NPDC001941]|uniref:dihydrofolate reductase family protein n=1 Tax=Streptomyces sp. NPDC001941 TaxID=3154659 RepID=UPI00332E3A2D
MRTLTYFVACSVDGFIADPDGDASSMMKYVDGEFLEYLTDRYPDTIAEEGRKALGVDGVPNRRFDTVIQGTGSYRLGLDAGFPSPYGHLREIVASRTLTESPHPRVELVHGDRLVERVRELKAEDGPLGIWLCGGSKVAGSLFDEVDELVVKTYPEVYGAGLPMFGAGSSPAAFALEECRVFGNGVIVRTYSRVRP